MTLEGIDDVHAGDGLTASVLSVSDRVTDDVLQEDLEHTTGLFVDETGDTLHTTTTSETTDSGLGDTLDVITKDLTVTLGASLSQSFSSFSSARHVCLLVCWLLRLSRFVRFVRLSTVKNLEAPRPSGSAKKARSTDLVHNYRAFLCM